MTCSICGKNDPSEHRVTRGFIVFCCAECAPLVEDVHTAFRPGAESVGVK